MLRELVDVDPALRKVFPVGRIRGTLWSPLLLTVGCLLAAAAVWFAFPTTTTYYPSPGFMPVMVTEAAEVALTEPLEVEVNPTASTLAVTDASGDTDVILVPSSLLSDAALLLASRGADVQWPEGTSAWQLTSESLAPVQVASPFLEFVRWLLLTVCVVGGAVAVGVFVRRRLMGARFRTAGSAGEVVPLTRFADVAGANEAVEDLQEVVTYLKDPSTLERFGARAPHGVLLVGPPGTGKTLLARAVAGEAGATFFAASGADFMERYVGVGSARVRDLFTRARRHAPSIVFIDEIDAVGKSRSDADSGHSAESDHTLIALLNELDGFHPRDRVVVIAATNRSDVLDPALVRAGRLERRVEVPLPDRRGRLRILEVSARDMPLGNDVDLANVAARTPGFSGAQLARLMNEAALRAARRSGRWISPDDVQGALADIAMGKARHSALVTDRDRELTAWHEAGHACAALVLRRVTDPTAVSIVPRGPAGGVTWLSEPEDSYFTREDAHARMVVAMSGRAAEKLLLNGEFTQGAAHDVETATQIAEALATRFAMTDTLASYRHRSHSGWSSEEARVIEKLVAGATSAADSLVSGHAEFVRGVAVALLEEEELSGDRLQGLWRAHGSPVIDLPPVLPRSVDPVQGVSVVLRPRLRRSWWRRSAGSS